MLLYLFYHKHCEKIGTLLKAIHDDKPFNIKDLTRNLDLVTAVVSLRDIYIHIILKYFGISINKQHTPSL